MNLQTFFMSEDIDLILKGNSLFGDFYTQRGLVVPDKNKITEIRRNMLNNLKETYGNVEVIPEQQLLQAMEDLAKSAGYPLVSLDKIYLNKNENVEEYLNLSRIRIGNKTFLSTRSCEGLYLPYEKEIERVCQNLKQTFGDNRPHQNFAY